MLKLWLQLDINAFYPTSKMKKRTFWIYFYLDYNMEAKP